MKRIGRLLALTGLILWLAAPARAAYINWTGESFVYPSSNQATSGCAASSWPNPLCYAEFADGASSYAALHAVVPQDMPINPAPRLKCTLWAYHPSTGTGVGRFTVGLAAYPATADVSPISNPNTQTIDISFQNTGGELATATAATFTTIYNWDTQTNCATDASCLGTPLTVLVGRVGGDGADTLTQAARVTAVVCEY